MCVQSTALAFPNIPPHIPHTLYPPQINKHTRTFSFFSANATGKCSLIRFKGKRMNNVMTYAGIFCECIIIFSFVYFFPPLSFYSLLPYIESFFFFTRIIELFIRFQMIHLLFTFLYFHTLMFSNVGHEFGFFLFFPRASSFFLLTSFLSIKFFVVIKAWQLTHRIHLYSCLKWKNVHDVS